MDNLFSQTQNKIENKANSYTAEHIDVLEGLEAVRKRPAMYIGGTDIEALHHLVKEILDNSFDEAVAGFANRIDISVEEGNRITISDNGRGIPVDMHPKYPDKSALEVILTTLHSGGKFNNKVYETSGGLHGVGISVVNALSEILDVEVARDKQLYTQSYSRGFPLGKIENKGAVSNRRGTKISFVPDQEIFGNLKFKPAKIYQFAKSKAYLYNGVKVYWSCAPSLLNDQEIPTEQVIHYPRGLVDYLATHTEDSPQVTDNFFAGNASLGGSGKVEWAVTWYQYGDANLRSYCNTIHTPQGGTHENGFKSGLLKSIKQFAEHVTSKKAAQITADDILDNMFGVLSVFISQPEFQGQTKDKLVSTQVTKLVEAVVKDTADHWLSANPDQAQKLLQFFIDKSDERLSRKKSKDMTRKTLTDRITLPGKLADCSKKTAAGTELFLVEGDSAGGSAKQARLRETQAILPLRGKILNVASASLDKLNANQGLSDLEQALGCGSGKSFKLEKLRYERIVIMTDADVDGAHIASLLMTYFFIQMPELVRKGHLFIAKAPLYRLIHGNKTYYVYSDKEKEDMLKTLESKRAKVLISRFKGLGEMTASQLKETTMNPETRTLYKVKLEDAAFAAATLQVENLLGKNPESRFNFIQEQALANPAFLESLDT